MESKQTTMPNQPVNAVDVVTEKLSNLIRSALNHPDEDLGIFQTEMNGMLNSHALSPNEAITILSRLISSIKMLAEYNRYQILLNEIPGRNLIGKSYTDFTDSTDRKAAVIGAMVNSFPTALKELLQYPNKN